MRVLDEPIYKHNEDLLGRRKFAQSVASIFSTLDHVSVRVGIFGDWGEGKTSTLALIQEQATAEGIKGGWVYPWAASSAEALNRDILFTIAESLGVSGKVARTASYLSGQSTYLRKLTQESGWKFRAADAAFGGLAESGLSRIKGRTEKRILARILETLETTKVVIYIDDLDRTPPELIPQLLMLIRSALNFPNLFYVVAISPKHLRKGLSAIPGSWKDEGFLDKIIEYPFYLPPITPDSLTLLIQSGLDDCDERTCNAVMAIRDYLGSNPRQIKMFLRYLRGIEPLLARFNDSEINFGDLFLCQLLRVRFPLQTKELIGDSKVLHDLGYGAVVSDLKKKEDLEHYVKYAPEGELRETFVGLCDAIRDRGPFHRYSVERMLNLLDSPPFMTWKETELFFRDLVNVEDPDRTLRLDEQLSRQSENPNWLFRMSLDFRDLALGAAADQDLESGVLEIIDLVQAVHWVLTKIIEERGDLLDGDNLKYALGRLGNWAHFTAPDYYEPLRNEEALLIAKIGTSVSEGNLGTILRHAQDLSSDLPTMQRAGEAGRYVEALDEMSTVVKERVASRVLRLFREPEGIDIFWGERSSIAEKRVLFDPGSELYTGDRLAELKAVFSEASGSDVVQMNCLTFLRMLNYGALDEGATFPTTACRERIRDQEFVTTLWRAALERPLNLRTVGSLERNRRRLLSELLVPEEYFVLPGWYREMVRSNLSGSEA